MSDPAIILRQELRSAQSCSFDANVTADYGMQIYTFQLQCRFDESGNMSFVVISPDTISGIRGSIEHSGGKLTFDETFLGFELLADGVLSPISAPWIAFKAIRSGYVSWSGSGNDQVQIRYDDTFDSKTFQTDLWLNREGQPLRAEIVWEGRRILSVDVANFHLQ